MIRSLAAVIFAVVIALTTAKFIENIGLTLAPAAIGGDVAAPAGWRGATLIYKSWLVGGWFIASFLAGAVALFLARRWAPVGGLASAAVALNAILSLAQVRAGLLIWIICGLLIVTGGWLAQRVLKARPDFPLSTGKRLFDA